MYIWSVPLECCSKSLVKPGQSGPVLSIKLSLNLPYPAIYIRPYRCPVSDPVLTQQGEVSLWQEIAQNHKVVWCGLLMPIEFYNFIITRLKKYNGCKNGYGWSGINPELRIHYVFNWSSLDPCLLQDSHTGSDTPLNLTQSAGVQYCLM